jgi:hypothetical protein
MNCLSSEDLKEEKLLTHIEAYAESSGTSNLWVKLLPQHLRSQLAKLA